MREEKLWLLISETLNIINEDYAGHGQRLAYIMSMLLDCQCVDTEIKWKMVFLSAFHDIGAYRTNEEKSLLKFEASQTLSHSIYSYLFLKWFSPMREFSAPLLYHHAHYQTNASPDHLNGLKIHLVERMDVLLQLGYSGEEAMDCLRAKSDIMFSASDIEALEQLVRNTDMVEDLATGNYIPKLEEYICGLAFPEETVLEFIRMLIFTFELYSKETMHHSNSTALLSRLLGQYCGLDSHLCKDLYFAGLIHDLGKVKIPLHILGKPGALNRSEMKVMEMHVQYTRELTEGIFPDQVVRVACCHHEKLDGSGYPNGLTADQLTVEAQILCVADIISALYCKRSYKDHFSNEKVAEVISKMADYGKISRQAVETFFAHFDDIIDQLAKQTKSTKQRMVMYRKEYARLHADEALRALCN